MDVKISVEREYWWIPTWNGNDKAEKPMRMRKRMLTGGERVRYLTPMNGALGTDNEAIFSATVLEVEGLTGSGKALTSGAQILAYSEFYILIMESITETLTHVGPDLKNS